MISVEAALHLVLSHAPLLPAETIPLKASLGRVLRENVYADRDFPPFDRVTMDGIAIQYAAFAAGQRSFALGGFVAAGTAPLPLPHPAAALEVATGAVLPPGTDTVVRYEDLLIADGQALIQTDQVRQGQNIHAQAMDRKTQDLLLPAGRRISAAEWGTLATVGKSEVVVSRLPRTAIVATGDELTAIEVSPLPWQIRRSNDLALQALMATWGIATDLFHEQDNLAGLQKSVKKILADYEFILLCGAVSAGRRDHLPQVLAEAGVNGIFHKVAQRPGKPLWFGVKGDRTVFALPGNPVSAFVCVLRYVWPWLEKSLGCESVRPKYARLAETVVFQTDLSYFMPVRLENRLGEWLAHPLAGHGSGDLANLNEADGFLELPRGKEEFRAGEAFVVYSYR